MSWAINNYGTRAQMITAIAAIDPGPDVGAAGQLADAQTLMLSRIASFPTGPNQFFTIYSTGYKDRFSDIISIKITPGTITAQNVFIDGSNVAEKP
jgi:hypothetical protein